MGPRADYSLLVGQRFGRLVVVGYEAKPRKVGTPRLLVCRCDCGLETTAIAGQLKQGSKMSCGCLAEEARRVAGLNRRTHQMSFSCEYRSYDAMKSRCLRKNHTSYPQYGGSGVKICDRWLESFENFYADMGPRPPGTTLDRFPDKNGNYEPGNCRWATPKEQRNNCRDNVILTHNGETMSLMDWSSRLGIGYSVLENRRRAGWSTDEVLSTPLVPQSQKASVQNRLRRQRIRDRGGVA